MRKRSVITVVLALFLTSFTSPRLTTAQQTAKEGEAQLKPADSYKVEFTVNEMDNGKKINSRTYSMLLRVTAPPHWTDMRRLRVGSKVPFPSGPGPGMYRYQDVGMDIDCRLMPMENGKVAIGTIWEYSSLGGEQGHESPAGPVIRHVRSEVEAVAPMDKPTVISEVDDVASTHRYVFEVKVTKVNP